MMSDDIKEQELKPCGLETSEAGVVGLHPVQSLGVSAHFSVQPVSFLFS
jgi:hypothetical protein